jgi:hypothetical protein
VTVAEEPPIALVALDNDVMLKAACYGLAEHLWPEDGETGLAVLGTARFVVPVYIERAKLAQGPKQALADVEALLDRALRLEPNDQEVALAVEFEEAASLAGLALDGGESMLCAIALLRGPAFLHTGDKRAIKALEALLDSLATLAGLAGAVRCLEQLVLGAVAAAECFEEVAGAICAEPSVDKTLSICFSCFSESHAGHEAARSALENYIAELRANAPRMLAEGT